MGEEWRRFSIPLGTLVMMMVAAPLVLILVGLEPMLVIVGFAPTLMVCSFVVVLVRSWNNPESAPRAGGDQ